MVSDLRVVDVPLGKEACAICGLVRRTTSAHARLFESGYQLYDHAPGAPRETARQDTYADWLSAHLPREPRSVLDLGCGNGSLLLALARRWPHATLRGIDPSAESITRARAAGIDAHVATVGPGCAEPCDAVISVNVVEHVDHPLEFLRSMAALVREGGSLLLVCPDGGRPWLELLFVDHRWSFTADHLSRLAAAAGLTVVNRTTAPASLGPFQLVRLERAKGAAAEVVSSSGIDALIGAKRRYLEAWAHLDQELVARSGGASTVTCFGIGEAAGLLRAYTPGIWSRVELCVADRPERRTFGDVRVAEYGGGRLDAPVLLAVRPDAQDSVARRLEGSGCSVIRWDDRIGA